MPPGEELRNRASQCDDDHDERANDHGVLPKEKLASSLGSQASWLGLGAHNELSFIQPLYDKSNTICGGLNGVRSPVSARVPCCPASASRRRNISYSGDFEME